MIVLKKYCVRNSKQNYVENFSVKKSKNVLKNTKNLC